MMMFRKSQSPTYSTPLALRLADGSPRAVFPPQVVGSFRRMVTGLKYRETLPARIAIVASLRGEGVTHTALALGTTLANDMNVRVCVVELNWWAPGMLTQLANRLDEKRQPRRLGLFGRDRQPEAPANATPSSPLNSRGVAGVLTGAVSLDEALIPTALPTLMLLPAGDLPPEQRPSQARSDALKELIAELEQRFDHVLLDIPAITATSDSVALASQAECCCMVVRQGVTLNSIVRQSLDEIKHLDVRGVVMNHFHTSTPRWILSYIPQE